MSTTLRRPQERPHDATSLQPTATTGCSTAAAAAAACSCPRCRSASGRTSATTGRSRRAARSSGAPSTSGSPTSTSRTTTGRRTARRRRTSAGSSSDDLRPYRDELVISTKAGYDMWPGPYGEWGSRKYLLASLDQSARADGPRLRRHLLLAPLRPRHAARGDDGRARHRRARRARRSTPASPPTRPSRRARRRRSCAQLGTPLLIHQPSYSMLNRWIEPELLDTLERDGVGCIGFSPLAQGMLTDRYLDGIPEGSRASREGLALARPAERARRSRRSAR